jgi:hypothetical protein
MALSLLYIRKGTRNLAIVKVVRIDICPYLMNSIRVVNGMLLKTGGKMNKPNQKFDPVRK